MTPQISTTRPAGFGLVALAVLTTIAALTACSSDATTTANRRSSQPATLNILVTNDDGFDAPGIDVVTNALRTLAHVKVTVVAPATNKSGSGSQSTPGTLTASKRTTASGYPATAVDGFPADTVRYATETLGLDPDLVVSGLNAGQNLGPITTISGTVGAAKAAAAIGIPAIAASQGLGAAPRYDVGATLVLTWVRAHRAEILGRGATVEVVNLNIPSCSTPLRGVKVVPLATEAAGAVEMPNCTSTVTDTPNDITAFRNGFASVTQLSPAGTGVTTSTTWPSPR